MTTQTTGINWQIVNLDAGMLAQDIEGTLSTKGFKPVGASLANRIFSVDNSEYETLHGVRGVFRRVTGRFSAESVIVFAGGLPLGLETQYRGIAVTCWKEYGVFTGGVNLGIPSPFYNSAEKISTVNGNELTAPGLGDGLLKKIGV